MDCFADFETKTIVCQVQQVRVLVRQSSIFGSCELAEGIYVDPQKIEVVVKWERPTNVSKI